MKKKDYLILLLGIMIIVLVFYKYRIFEYALILAIIGFLVFLALLLSFLMMSEKIKFRKSGLRDIYIFSCCFINDDVNFFKIFKIISRKVSNDLSNIKAMDFINYLREKNLLIKFRGSENLEKICEDINFLLKNSNVNLEIKSADIDVNDDNGTFIYYLNIITKIIRENGYELVQIYPASMYKKKECYYFVVVVSINRLLDLGEIGFLG